MRLFKRIAAVAAGVLIIAAVSGVGVVAYQGKSEPSGNPEYVALGSSFAAGLGLGHRAVGSAFACQRSVNGYPEQLAKLTGQSIVDMTCSGSTITHIVRGGQFFQGPQVRAVTASTRLVTLTSGGNDIGYVGDLVMMAYGNRSALVRSLLELVTTFPHADADRGIVEVEPNLREAIGVIRQRSPSAHIVIATYPAILPAKGTCTALGLTEDQVDSMRPVAEELARATRAAATGEGVTLVDMAVIGAGHDACSAAPWTNGSSPQKGAPFHPTLAGAQATANEIRNALDGNVAN